MNKDILTQLAVFRLAAEFRYSGPESWRGMVGPPVHHWKVLVTNRANPSMVLEDGHTTTKNEYLAAQQGVLDLTDRYFKTLMGRVERVRKLKDRRNFTAWCSLSGVRPDDLKKHPSQQSFWRSRFDGDCRVAEEFTELLGGTDRVEEFLSTTIR